MSGWLWLLPAAGLLALILCTRLKVTGHYDERGGTLTVRLGVLTLLAFPGDPIERIEILTGLKQTENTEAELYSEKGGAVQPFQELTGNITALLGKLRRRLCVDELTLWYLSAAEDPAAAALAFGAANAAAGLLLKPLEQAFRIRKRDIRTAVSFTETKPTVYAVLRLSLDLFTFVVLVVKVRLLKRKIRRRAAKTEV